MQTLIRAACAVIFVTIPALAHAQGQTAVQLNDPNPPKWDASGHVSWLTVDKSDIAPEWNRWYDAATFGGSLGRFFGPHLKLELDAATSTSAEVYTSRQVTIPTQPNPIFVSQSQRFQTTTVGVGASYQFLNNRWFHPVVGAGLESTREKRTIDQPFYPFPLPGSIDIDPPGTAVTWTARPYGDIGFKWFVSERAFIRSSVRTSFDRGGASHVSWRTGVGFDF